MDDDRYLESGFDPSTLKVSALRNILVKHSVEFPSNAKKSELLRIMQTKVLDKSKTLRKEARRQKQVKADSRDIEMVAASGSQASKHSDHSTDAPSTEPTEKRAQKLKKRKKRKHAETVGESDKESDSAVFTPAKHKQVERQRLGKRRLQKPAEEEEESGERESDMAKNKKKSVAEDRRSNFSDENPFQRSPATPERKRRRKAQGADKSATTPLSALRTSKPSDVSFQVSLPGTPTPKKKEEEDGSVVGSPQSVASPTSKGKGGQPRSRVSDLVAKYQGQIATKDAEPVSPRKAQEPEEPKESEEAAEEGAEGQAEEPVEAEMEDAEIEMEAVEEQAEEPAEEPAEVETQRRAIPPPMQPLFDSTVNPEASASRRHPISASTRPGRFTMTPESLRQMAASHSASIASPRRRTMGGELPPVAPNIPVAAAAADSSHLSLAQAQADAVSLQRRRVETLRMQHRGEGSVGGHSRQSSIASIASAVGEARGIPATPAAPSRPASESRGSPWGWRVLVLGAIAAAMGVWRTHEQMAIGFGASRAGEPVLAPPADSVLALPEPVAQDAPAVEQAQYYVRLARAMYLSPAPLECPSHASCEPYAAIPASHASQLMVDARDQWVVPGADGEARAVMQCDPGYVVQFPRYSSRVLPLPPACVRDLSAENRVKRLADAILRECARVRGQRQCEQPVYAQVRELVAKYRRPVTESDESAEDGEEGTMHEADFIERFGIRTSELRQLLRSRTPSRVSDDEFDLAFKLALEELDANHTDQVQSYLLEYDDATGDVAYLMSHRPTYPLLCRLRRFALSALIGNMTGVVSAVGLFVVSLVASRRLAMHRAEKQAADLLVGAAVEKLKRQARRHYLDPALSPSAAIPSLQLRDLLLLSSTETPGDSAYYDPRTRASVWERVRVVVERNANVRSRTTTVRGEPMRVWEWIGPTDDVVIFPAGESQ